MIGMTFPVKDHDDIKSIPWGVIEAHRAQASTNHGAPLERLHTLGGLTCEEIARVIKGVGPGESIAPGDVDALVKQYGTPKETKE